MSGFTEVSVSQGHERGWYMRWSACLCPVSVFVECWRDYMQEAGSLAKPLSQSSMLKIRHAIQDGNKEGGVRRRKGKSMPIERKGSVSMLVCRQHFATYEKHLQAHPLLKTEPGRILNMDESGRDEFAVAPLGSGPHLI